MPAPLNPNDTEVINGRKKELSDQITGSQKGKEQIQTKSIPNNEKKETTNKKLFDYYDSIVSSYEKEIKPIKGTYIISPILEQDILNRSTFTGRLYDTSGAQDVIKVPEFTGGNTATASDYENLKFPLYSPPITRLTHGLETTCTYNNSAETTITPTSSSFRVNSISGLSTGKEVIIEKTGESFIANVTNLVPYGSMGVHTVNFTFVTPIANNVATGASVKGAWTGYTNTERTTKVSPLYQTVMNYYISKINEVLSAHIAFLNTQKLAIFSNQDDSLDPNIKTNITNRVNQYITYRSTTDISDTGISTLTNLNSTRQPEAAARAIAANTAKSKYYDKRYFWAVERCGNEGTLTTRKGLQDSITRLDSSIATNQAKLNSLNSNV